jgi:hypothetical protein
MNYYEVKFEDLELDAAISVTGSFIVEYTVEDAQPDCGYAGGIEIHDYTDLVCVATVTDEDGEIIAIFTPKDNATLSKIVKHIDASAIRDEIEENQ